MSPIGEDCHSVGVGQAAVSELCSASIHGAYRKERIAGSFSAPGEAERRGECAFWP